MKEEWRETEYSGYWVSNLGDLENRNPKKHRKLQKHNKGGYATYLISYNKKKFYPKAARLVAKAFLSKIDNKNYVNHKNGNKLDDSVENLEWCTARENILHARDVLGAYRGERNAKSKLNKEKVLQIFKLFSSGIPKRQIARYLEISDTAVRYVLLKKNWGWIHENNN